MKRRNWIWFIASAVLAVLAGVLALVALNWAATQEMIVSPASRQPVVIARQPLAANTVLRADNLTVEERQEIPSGAAVRVQDVLGAMTLRDIAQGEVIRMQDLASMGQRRDLPQLLGDDKIAVAMLANDVLSQWGAVLPGDHVDVLFTFDVILETPMHLEELAETGGSVAGIERDQSMDYVSMLAVQNAEVLQILVEPRPETADTPQEGVPLEPQRRALLLKVDPQDALMLKYLRDSVSRIDLALRSPTNTFFFEVQPVNINYLQLRYGILVPQPLEE